MTDESITLFIIFFICNCIHKVYNDYKETQQWNRLFRVGSYSFNFLATIGVVSRFEEKLDRRINEIVNSLNLRNNPQSTPAPSDN